MPRRKGKGGASKRDASRRGGSGPRPSGEVGVRPFWSGTVSFGLVSIPVDLYPANRPRQAGLRMLGPEGAPLRREYHNPDTGDAIETAAVVRGYEVEKGEFVVLTDEELDAAEPERTRDIALDAFVERDALDPMFFDRAYFLVPQENAGKAYRLLAEAMEGDELAGIARFVMRSKEYLVAILSENGVLRAETMRFADEIRTPADVGLPDAPKKAKASLVKAMSKAIDELASETLPEEALRDEYLAELRRIAEAKRKKGEGVVEVEDGAEEDDGGAVIDLMDVLRRSMEGARAGRSDGAAKSGRKGPRKATSPQPRASKKRAAALSEMTRDELYERAKELDVPGRSSMTRDELEKAVRKSA